jgi:2Fe-2S ferredoxin
MVTVTFIAADGAETLVQATEGLSLMENAVAGGIAAIEAICGGNAYCGTCKVYVDPAWRSVTGERTDIELPILKDSEDADSGARLSCQISVTAELNGLVVRTPASQG